MVQSAEDSSTELTFYSRKSYFAQEGALEDVTVKVGGAVSKWISEVCFDVIRHIGLRI